MIRLFLHMRGDTRVQGREEIQGVNEGIGVLFEKGSGDLLGFNGSV